MSQPVLLRTPAKRTFSPTQEFCPHDDGTLWISQHRVRTIHRLDESIEATFRDSKCHQPDCPLGQLRYRPAEESMLALPGSNFGLDVLMAIGSMRLRDDFSFPRIHQRLRERGVPIAPMTVQYQFRYYLSLISCQTGLSDSRVRQALRRQGMILPVIDGIQFGPGDPVLYLIIDALSRYPLFGKEMFCRNAEELEPFIAQLKQMDIPILAVVSDKEKALVPAIENALPGVPHQLCQVHYIGNAAKPMEDDLKALGAEIRETEENLRRFQRKLIRCKSKAEKKNEAPPEDLEVSLELCEAARAEARRHARAPFHPPPIKRHEGLETVAQATAEARRKKGGLGRTSMSCKPS